MIFLLELFATKEVMVAAFTLFALINIAFIVANRYIKDFSSRLFPWLYTVLTAPFIVIFAMLSLLDGDYLQRITVLQVAQFISSGVMAVTSLYLYIRCLIKPIDRNAPKLQGYDAVQLKFIGARRFLITGLILTVISGIALVIAGVYAASSIVLMLVCLILAVCPALSLFAIIAIIGLGFSILEFIIVIILFVLSYLLLLNGCIRCTVASKKTKGTKVILILLCFIPSVGLIYGAMSIKEISGKIKTRNGI
ncbi:MAG: hypothetical protein IJ035_06685 [Oscillospiraceae bacterium]|nr:hypothetical protein [Oscillospiraceae bacterium]